MGCRSFLRSLAKAFLLVLIPLSSGTGAGGGIFPGGAVFAGGAVLGSLSTLGAQETQDTVTSGTIKALTYNVAGLPPGVSKSKPIQNMLRISPLLNDYDLVLVQEDFLFHRLLNLAARHEFKSDPQPLSGLVSMEFLTKVRGLSLTDLQDLSGFLGEDRLTNDGLNRFSKSAFTDFQRHPWVDCNGLADSGNDCMAPKGFTYARHEIAPGVFIDVYNLHGDAGRSPEDEAARRGEFQQLAAFIEEFSAGLPLILAGDTNLQDPVTADEEVMQEFMAATGTAIVSRTMGRPLGGTKDVDRFFYRGSESMELTPILLERPSEFFDGGGNPMSDHPAIRVDFAWKLR